MNRRNNSKTVKSEAENKSWFGKLVDKFYTKGQVVAPVQKRVYHHTSERQVLKMFDLRKKNPNLTLQDIADLVKVHVQVVRYWLSQPEEKIRADFKAKRSNRKSKSKKAKKKIVRQKLQTLSKIAPQNTVEEELTLSNFVSLSNYEGEKILKKIKHEEKDPIHHLANPKKWKGTLPSQAVASEDDWKEEDRKYNIGKATMHKAIVTKQQIEIQSKKDEKIKAKRKIEHQKGLQDGSLKIHTDDCPSCNPNSNLTLKEYAKVTFLVFKEMKKFAMQNDKTTKQLDNRSKQLDQIEKETLGTVAERVKEGTHLCETCDCRLTYPQSTRSSAKFDGHYFCADHEPKS